MSTAILIVALVAALACPLHMLWRMRRGHDVNARAAGQQDRCVRRAAVAAELASREPDRAKVPL